MKESQTIPVSCISYPGDNIHSMTASSGSSGVKNGMRRTSSELGSQSLHEGVFATHSCYVSLPGEDF